MKLVKLNEKKPQIMLAALSGLTSIYGVRAVRDVANLSGIDGINAVKDVACFASIEAVKNVPDILNSLL